MVEAGGEGYTVWGVSHKQRMLEAEGRGLSVKCGALVISSECWRRKGEGYTVWGVSHKQRMLEARNRALIYQTPANYQTLPASVNRRTVPDTPASHRPLPDNRQSLTLTQRSPALCYWHLSSSGDSRLEAR